MGSLSEDEEWRFFDAQEDIASVSDANSEGTDTSIAVRSSSDLVSSSFVYDVWLQCPGSVKERRDKFFNWMERNLDPIAHGDSLGEFGFEREVDRLRESSGAVLRTFVFEDEFCSSRSSMSCWSSGDPESFIYRDENPHGGMAYNVEETGDAGKAIDSCQVGSETISEEYMPGSTSSFQRLSAKEFEHQNSVKTSKGVKNGWLKRLRSIACAVDKQREAEKLRPNENDDILGYRIQRAKVRQYGKRSKELSALYKGQDIQAHEGSILTMKFSPDGQYLASAGEDGIVRLWQVVEDDRRNELDIPEIDPSCIYFTVNRLSELKPLFMDKEKISKLRSLRRTSDSACVIFPPKVFRILEKPLHEFYGHCGDILDLSWSKNNYLLSCSVDKTVRLWQVGCDNCLGVFSHSNYVTCVQFNPVDDNYFMTGSIDGKVRIWAISDRQVIDWTDIRDIVTALCYRPDGQGGIVGSMTGNCRFYNMSDNHLQLDAQICLHNKKKSPCKRITGFQYFPQDSSKVMVGCTDSQVRILHGLNVIGKYKGHRSAGNQMSACFTSDGKHIVSASEDSNVYMWNCVDEEGAISQAKNVKSCERFSTNASVAIPWHGLKYGNSENGYHFSVSSDKSLEPLPFTSPACFSLSQEFFLESFPKGHATWPEEKLPAASRLPSSSGLHKSHYKFLKSSCQGTSSSHAWGLVIVTAGLDGRIRSFHNYGLPVAV
ncbi:WD-40 repeat family protein [Tripterygium wilfordii]|uniref:WD-40 repeat family protein n=1 Tax=Tripterygium wilfordii TaxID=458696 RepID=A0A7J7CAY3_TRIWF|nr:uncharacterized protein LOC119985808 [Tripterygium wilfordii]KAF5731308.1 WD-40 repeat family protein [Tripterygium wilfordii]